MNVDATLTFSSSSSSCSPTTANMTTSHTNPHATSVAKEEAVQLILKYLVLLGTGFSYLVRVKFLNILYH